jgi:hypothetical protein
MTPDKENARARMILRRDPQTYAWGMYAFLTRVLGAPKYPLKEVLFQQKLKGGWAEYNGVVAIGTSLTDPFEVANTIHHELTHLFYWPDERSPRDTGHCRTYNKMLITGAQALWGIFCPLRSGYGPTDDLYERLYFRGSISFHPWFPLR